MLLRPPSQRPPTAVLSGLKYWWPCDDILAITSVSREVMQNAQGFGQTAVAPWSMTGRVAVSANAVGALRSTTSTTSGFIANITMPSPAFTVCFWWRPDSAPGTYGNMFAINTGSGRVAISTKSSGFYVWNTSNSFQDPSAVTPMGGNASGLDLHTAFNYDGTSFHIIENGITVLTSAGTSNSAAFAGTCRVGAQEIFSMRDVRIYNRALSVPETRMIWQEGFVPPVDVVDIAAIGGGAAAAASRTNPNMPMLGM